jgi:DNA polymerase III sliding clamp (beta) subunit (PCNA family)
MHFRIAKNEALRCLGMTSSVAVSGKSVNALLKTIKIVANKEQQLVTFRATDSVVDLTVSTTAEVLVDGACCIDSLLYGLVQTFQDGPIEIQISTVTKTSKLEVTQKGKIHKLAFIAAEQFPTKIELEDWQPADSSLVDALRRCAPSAAAIEDRPILQGFLVSPKQSTIFTTSGTQAASYDLKMVGSICVPPVKALERMLSIIQSETNLEVSFGKFVGFRGPNWELVVHTFAGEYPLKARDTLDAFKVKEPIFTLSMKTVELSRALESCRLYSDRAYADGKQHHTQITHRLKRTALTMTIQDLVDMSEPLDCKTTGLEEFMFWFHPSLLLSAVKLVKSEQIELRFYGQELPFLVLDANCPNWTYLQTAMALPKDVRAAQQKEKEAVVDKVEDEF